MKKKVFFGILILFVIGVLLSPLCFMSRIEGTWKPEKEGVVTVLLEMLKLPASRTIPAAIKKSPWSFPTKTRPVFIVLPLKNRTALKKGANIFSVLRHCLKMTILQKLPN